MMALSTRNDDPTAASRPYDKGRDGFVLGEGAGVLVLESEEHAAGPRRPDLRRGRRRRHTADAHHIAAARPRRAPAASRAMQDARSSEAGLAPTDIVHINAHATSTPHGDIAEADAIRARASATHADDMSRHRHQVDDRPPARRAPARSRRSPPCWRCTTGVAPPTINLDDHDPKVDLDIVRGEPRDAARRRHRRAQQLLRLRRPQRRPRRPQRLSRPPHRTPRGATRASTTTPGRFLPGASSRCVAADGVGRSADLVQPAHRGAVAGVPEGLELVVPVGAEQHVDLVLQRLGVAVRAQQRPRAGGPR